MNERLADPLVAAAVGKMGSVLSNVSGALAIAGLVIAPIPGSGRTDAGSGGRGRGHALGGLAFQGIAKAAGDSNITYGDLFTDALGAIPGGGVAEDVAEGANVPKLATQTAKVTDKASGVLLDTGAVIKYNSAGSDPGRRAAAGQR